MIVYSHIPIDLELSVLKTSLLLLCSCISFIPNTIYKPCKPIYNQHKSIFVYLNLITSLCTKDIVLYQVFLPCFL